VFNTAAKLEFALAAVALGLGIGLQLSVVEPTGFYLLLSIATAALLAGLALTGSGLPDSARRYGSDAPPVEMVSTDQSVIARPSVWPLAAALAAGVFGVGLAVGDTVVIIGIGLAFIAAAGWLAQSWQEDPAFTPREGIKLSDRLIAPIGLPLLALGLVAVIVLSVSRILLAVPKDASIAIAGVFAVLLLAAFFFLAARPRVPKSAFVVLSGFAVVSVVAAGSVSAASGYRTFEHPTEAATVPVVRAQGLKYNVQQLTVKAGDVTRITFENLDKGVYHNIAVYSQPVGGQPVWNGEPIAGVKKIAYAHVFATAGTYSFRCDFHPTTMVGFFTVSGQ
jgi:plastocyanin